MSPEHKITNFHQNETPNLIFEKKSFRENNVSYIFDGVIVSIDNPGINYKGKPEISFGTFSGKLTETLNSTVLLSKPETKQIGVDMNYVNSCIKEVAKESKIHEFWFYPFGEDAKKNEQEQDQEKARVRLFSRYFNIRPDEENFGYIITI